ncbi:MAG: hypothetical protein KAT28_02000 [Candidatus Aenigmarchaeota archaeon]|nr:hypothetical protein [Candidatus Aenigmarchaeota archaeon]
MIDTRKGQVSLEYLMTYGIAIAIVVIAIAALYSMGVFNPSSSAMPCSPCFSSFAYVDYADGELMIKNGPRALENVYCNVTGGTCNIDSFALVNLSANQQFKITLGNKTEQNVPLTLSYTDALSGLPHTDIATIHN